MTEELLGGGLDIEGWNYLRNERQAKINEITDRGLILRSTFPLVMKTKFEKKEKRDTLDFVSSILEQKTTIDPPWIAEKLKREFDTRFGAPWHVIVGEAYSFNIDYDFNFLYYFLYGPIAILVWRCGSVLPCEINHKNEKRKNAKGKDPNMIKKKKKNAADDRI